MNKELKVLISEEELTERIKNVADEINNYFGEKEDDPNSENYGQPKNEIKIWDEEHQTGEKNPLSSVVAFYSKAYTSLASITETNYYNVPIAEYDAESGYTRETFVQFNETTTEYQSFIQRKNLYEGTTGDVLYIAIVVDYYHYALEYVYNTFIGNTTLEDRIYFECDWNMVIQYEKKVNITIICRINIYVTCRRNRRFFSMVI